MIKERYQDAQQIIAHAIRQVLPDAAVKKALSDKKYPHNVCLITVVWVVVIRNWHWQRPRELPD